MPKEKYDPPDPRRMYTIMSSEEAANGKKSYWAELEISGEYCQSFWFCRQIICFTYDCSHTLFYVDVNYYIYMLDNFPFLKMLDKSLQK